MKNILFSGVSCHQSFCKHLVHQWNNVLIDAIIAHLTWLLLVCRELAVGRGSTAPLSEMPKVLKTDSWDGKDGQVSEVEVPI